MIDGLTIAMAIVAIILCAVAAWLYLKNPNKKPKRISKSTKPFHPELLTNYKTSARGGTTFRGNAKTPEERRQAQMEKDWKR